MRDPKDHDDRPGSARTMARAAVDRVSFQLRREAEHARLELHLRTGNVRVAGRTVRGAAAVVAVAMVAAAACLVRMLELGAPPWIAGLVVGSIAGVACAGLGIWSRRRFLRAADPGRGDAPEPWREAEDDPEDLRKAS